MGLVDTDPLTLHPSRDIFAREAETMQDTNKAYRHASYRQYTLWVYGRLHRDGRPVFPSCCIRVIRGRYPDPNDTGFIPNKLLTNSRFSDDIHSCNDRLG